jgi:DNA-binding response OmpR family regulator
MEEAFGAVLLDWGLATQDQLTSARNRNPHHTALSLADVLVTERVVDERSMAMALAEVTGWRIAVLQQSCVDLRALALAPQALTAPFGDDEEAALIFPVAADGSHVVVVTDRLLDADEVEGQLFTGGRSLQLLLGLRSQIVGAQRAAIAALARGAALACGSHAPSHAHVEQIHPPAGSQPVRRPEPLSTRSNEGQAVGMLRVKRVATQRAVSLPSQRSAPGERVLVIDAHPGRKSLLHNLCTQDGCTVTQVTDWEAGWWSLLSVGADLVIFDPTNGAAGEGAAFCQRLRAHPTIGQTAVILLGRKSQVSSWSYAFEQLGVDSYLPDPIDGWWLRHTICQALERPMPLRPTVSSEDLNPILSACENAVMSGDDDELRRALERWLAVDSCSGQAWFELAQLHVDDPTHHQLCLERAVAFEPTLFNAQLALARCAARLLMPQRAERALQAASSVVQDAAQLEQLRAARQSVATVLCAR